MKDVKIEEYVKNRCENDYAGFDCVGRSRWAAFGVNPVTSKIRNVGLENFMNSKIW